MIRKLDKRCRKNQRGKRLFKTRVDGTSSTLPHPPLAPEWTLSDPNPSLQEEDEQD